MGRDVQSTVSSQKSPSVCRLFLSSASLRLSPSDRSRNFEGGLKTMVPVREGMVRMINTAALRRVACVCVCLFNPSPAPWQYSSCRCGFFSVPDFFSA